MPNKQIAITFESEIPVVGQILVLEAVDYLYSLEVLKEVGWGPEVVQLPGWPRIVADIPGKCLAREHTLKVTAAYTGSVTEEVSGIANAVEKLVEFIGCFKTKKQEAQLKNIEQKLRIVQDHYMPLIEKLKKEGVPEEDIQRLVARAYQYIDQVMTELILQNKLNVQLIASRGGR